MNLVNNSFFIRDINIAQSNTSSVSEKIDMFISKYEPEFLLNLLGYPLYKKFISENSERMSYIINGCEFENENQDLSNFEGIILNDIKYSPIAQYVFCKILKKSQSIVTGVGVFTSKSDSGSNVVPSSDFSQSWNAMSDSVSVALDFLSLKKNEDGELLYPEFNFYQKTKALNFFAKVNDFNF